MVDGKNHQKSWFVSFGLLEMGSEPAYDSPTSKLTSGIPFPSTAKPAVRQPRYPRTDAGSHSLEVFEFRKRVWVARSVNWFMYPKSLPLGSPRGPMSCRPTWRRLRPAHTAAADRTARSWYTRILSYELDSAAGQFQAQASNKPRGGSFTFAAAELGGRELLYGLGVSDGVRRLRQIRTCMEHMCHLPFQEAGSACARLTPY